MEPRIQYAQTTDGVSIAFWALGEGTSLVLLPVIPFSHSQLDWQNPGMREFYERLGEKRRIVRYDSRGSGLSETRVADHSLEAHVRDLQAVIERLALNRLVLWGFLGSGPLAIAYAARHPEPVSHLILWCSFVQASDMLDSPQFQGLLGLMEKDWELFTETMANVVFGWSAGEPARNFAEYMRASTTQEVFQTELAALAELDVTDLLPQVKAPTLVFHRREMIYPGVSAARRLASQIPDARLMVVEGSSAQIGEDVSDLVVRAVDEFLSEGEKTVPGREAQEAGRLVTILFTDMESSTALTQSLGDAKAQELLRTHNAIVRDALKSHGGSEIKHTGDGIMASFPSASGALECAVEIQRGVGEREADTPLRVRIGLNAGEPVAEEQDLFGTAVQLAKRICDHAEPGQILAPIVVRELAAGKGFLFADIGETALRGFQEPARLYEVRWREDG